MRDPITAQVPLWDDEQALRHFAMMMGDGCYLRQDPQTGQTVAEVRREGGGVVEAPGGTWVTKSGDHFVVSLGKPAEPEREVVGPGTGLEIQPDELAADPILKFFGWEHLRPEMQETSRPFGQLAAWIVRTLPRNAERTVALRKLLEAKDAAVRASVQ